MDLIKIRINGYKSIDSLELPVEKHGEMESYTSFFLGKNEAGKSNILEAMSVPNLFLSQEESNYFKIRNQITEPAEVSVEFVFDILDNELKDFLLENNVCSNAIFDVIKISQIKLRYYLSSEATKYNLTTDFTLEIADGGLDNFYIVTEETQAATPNKNPHASSNAEPYIAGIFAEEELPQTDGSGISLSTLDKETLEKFLSPFVSKFVTEKKTFTINSWKSSSDFLIQDAISLKEFANNPSNIPLRNMFFLVGCKNNSDISKKIKEAELNAKSRRKLAKLLSDKTTAYLNKKWREHEVTIQVEIDATLQANVFVVDNCNTENYFYMGDRSQGFKQFVSLLLSLSIGNESGEIRDNLILIDEPEVHLHPSGVRWMMRELLEIGLNNYVFIATHSNFMMDRKTPERHFLIIKNKDDNTGCIQVQSEEDINGDEILKTAFGINTILDFLPNRRLLLEGKTDKKIICKALHKINPNNKIAVTNGDGNNLPAVASILAFQDISAMVVVDDDIAGIRMKNAAMSIGDLFKNSCFTVRDLCGTVPQGATIEDFLPLEFVKSMANRALKKNQMPPMPDLKEEEPFCKQVKDFAHFHLSSENSLKTEDAKKIMSQVLADFKMSVADYDEKSMTDDKCPKLLALVKAIIRILE